MMSKNVKKQMILLGIIFTAAFLNVDLLAQENESRPMVQDYFSESFSRLQVKECFKARTANVTWPMKRVFLKVSPQVGIGINQVLSLTAVPEIALGWEAVKSH